MEASARLSAPTPEDGVRAGVRLPHANARLTAVTRKGYSEDWDDAGTSGSSRWTGISDAYISDDQRNTYDSGRASKVISRSVIVPSGISVEVGDTLTISYKGATISPAVKGILQQEPPPGIEGTTVLEVELT